MAKKKQNPLWVNRQRARCLAKGVAIDFLERLGARSVYRKDKVLARDLERYIGVVRRPEESPTTYIIRCQRLLRHLSSNPDLQLEAQVVASIESDKNKAIQRDREKDEARAAKLARKEATRKAATKKERPAQVVEPEKIPEPIRRIDAAKALSPVFYRSKEWRTLRQEALDFYGRKCMACGAVSNLHVDHIIPITWEPTLALDFDNLQILCRGCNLSKGNRYVIDFR